MTEFRYFLAAVGLLALHVIDDNFLQPEAGTSAGDHLLSGLIPLAVLAVAAAAFPRMRPGWRAVTAASLGLFGVALGVEAVYYTAKVGPSGDDFSGLAALGAGVALLGLAVVTAWRSRKRSGHWGRRLGRRGLITVAVLLGADMVMLPLLVAYVLTHVMTPTVPAKEAGMAYQDVSFSASDGLQLEGWYIPSENRAAVIVYPGRSRPQDQARMLSAHGYGVLIFDRRGEGDSDGDPNLLGWGGHKDILGAVDFLQNRPDVDPDRVGGIGLSVGGELMLEAAAKTDDLKAVVSEGAGGRSIREDLLHSRPQVYLGALGLATQTLAMAVFSNEPVPPGLNDVVDDIAPNSVFFIYGERGQGQEIALTPMYFDSAQEPKSIWEAPDSAHIDAIHAQPDEYERRVIGFFDDTLLARS